MTPREFGLLADRHHEQTEREDARVALLCSVIANSNSGKKGKRYKPKDFMPQARQKREDWQSQLRYVEMLNVAMGGKDKRKAGDGQ